MRNSILSALILAAAFSNVSHVQGAERSRYNENNFVCGAVFGMLMTAYEQAGETAKAASHRLKYERLALQAEADFERIGRTKVAAEKYMQGYVDSHVRILDTDARQFASLSRYCEKLFPG